MATRCSAFWTSRPVHVRGALPAIRFGTGCRLFRPQAAWWRAHVTAHRIHSAGQSGPCAPAQPPLRFLVYRYGLGAVSKSFHRRQLIANLRESVTLARAAAVVWAPAVTVKPSQRQSAPSQLTRRCPFGETRANAADFGRLDDADGSKPPCERRWAFNERRGGFCPPATVQANRPVAAHANGPRCSIDWRWEVVIERGAQCLFVAWRDVDRIDQRWEKVCVVLL